MNTRDMAFVTIILTLAFVGLRGTVASADPCSCPLHEMTDLGNGVYKCPVYAQDRTGIKHLDVGIDLGIDYTKCVRATAAKKSTSECKIHFKKFRTFPRGCERIKN